MSSTMKGKRSNRREGSEAKNHLFSSSLLEPDSEDDELPIVLPLSQNSVSSVGGSSKNSLTSGRNLNPGAAPDDTLATNDALVVEALERQAHEIIVSRPFLLDFARDANYQVCALLWHKRATKSRKKELWLPCRRAKKDEAIGLTLQRRTEDQVLVRYIGDKIKDTGNLHYISPNQLLPLVDPDQPRAIRASHMANFLNSLPNTLDATDAAKPIQKVLERCILEAGIEECWKRNPNQSLMSLTEAIAAQASRKMAPYNCEDKDEHSVDDSSNLSSFEDFQEQETKASAQCNPNDLISWDSDNVQKTQTLKKGCVVVYNEPNQVAGNENLLCSKVVRVTPGRQEDFVLHLESGHMLRREDRVKLAKKMHYGRLVDNENAKFQLVGNYYLEKTPGDGGGWVGMKIVMQINDVLDDQADAIANNPETAILGDLLRRPVTTKNNKNGSKKRQTSTVASGCSTITCKVGSAKIDIHGNDEMLVKKKHKQRRMVSSNADSASKSGSHTEFGRLGRGSSKNEIKQKSGAETAVTPFEIPETWWKVTNRIEIEKKIRDIQVSAGRSRGRKAVHHMSLENLQCVLRARECLFNVVRGSAGGQSVTAILKGIVECYEKEHKAESPFSTQNLECFLSCDKNALVTRSILDQIAKEFRKWLSSVGLVDNNGGNCNSKDKIFAKETAEPNTKKTPNEDIGKPSRISTKKRSISAIALPNDHVLSKRSTKTSRRKTMGERRVSKVGLADGKDSGPSSTREMNSKDTASEMWWQETKMIDLEAMIVRITKSTQESARSNNNGRPSRAKSHHMSVEQLQLAIRVRGRMETMISDVSQVGDVLKQMQEQREEDPFDKRQLRQFLSGDTKQLIRLVELAEISKDLKSWLASSNDNEIERYVLPDPALLPIHAHTEAALALEQRADCGSQGVKQREDEVMNGVESDCGGQKIRDDNMKASVPQPLATCMCECTPEMPVDAGQKNLPQGSSPPIEDGGSRTETVMVAATASSEEKNVDGNDESSVAVAGGVPTSKAKEHSPDSIPHTSLLKEKPGLVPGNHVAPPPLPATVSNDFHGEREGAATQEANTEESEKAMNTLPIAETHLAMCQDTVAGQPPLKSNDNLPVERGLIIQSAEQAAVDSLMLPGIASAVTAIELKKIEFTNGGRVLLFSNRIDS